MKRIVVVSNLRSLLLIICLLCFADAFATNRNGGENKNKTYPAANSYYRHVYKINNDYFVNKLNKNIKDLSEKELKKLPKKVVDDINVLLQIDKNSDICYNPDKGPEYIFEDKNDFTGYVVRKMNKSSTALSLLNHSYGFSFNVTIQFIVEPDGTTSAPVVCAINDEETIKIVQAIFKQIRNSKDWLPAMKDGKPVRTMVKCDFNLSKKRY